MLLQVPELRWMGQGLCRKAPGLRMPQDAERSDLSSAPAREGDGPSVASSHATVSWTETSIWEGSWYIYFPGISKGARSLGWGRLSATSRTAHVPRHLAQGQVHPQGSP